VSTLVLPDPSLVVLIGAAGSGKSTLAARLFPPGEILSSDALRAAVSGNEADQRASAVVFRILHKTLERRLTAGMTTVIDATNTNAEQRRPLLERARAAGVPAVSIVLDLSSEVIHVQNAARTARIVDRAIVERHIAAIRHTIDGGRLVTEGFDHVVLLHSPTDVADLRLERRRPARPREPAPVWNRRR
jgi:predicted kinase